MTRVSPALAALVMVSAIGCDSSEETGCLAVTPGDDYVLSGTAGQQDFAPATKTYTVRNTCSDEIQLSVEENVRWLDVDIAAFGGGGNESGPVPAEASVAVVVEVRYGSDNPERLDQLAPGDYQASLFFDDDTNGGRVAREVEVTVGAPMVTVQAP